jgi:hypothetical protein
MVFQAINDLKSMICKYPIKRSNDRYVFVDENGIPRERPRAIGSRLYDEGGDAYLYFVMNELLSFVTFEIEKGNDWMEFDLRQLEFCWNGIGEWMA